MIFRSYHLQTLLLAALSCAAAAFAAETNSPPPCEIRFIPEQDLSRAEGYSASGTFLPLARLLELVRAADTGAPSAVAPGSVTCFKITLAGSLKPEDGSEGIADALKLDGAIEFDAPSAIWSATLIDDGAMPWTSQSFKPEKDAGSNSGVSAFLARVEGKTWLFARGPGRGSIRTEALLPVAFETSSEALRFGAFFAPCLIQIALPGGVRFDTANVPAEVRAETGDARLWIWPSQRIPAEAKFRRSIPFAGPTALRAQDNLIVAAVGANVAVAHHLYLEDRFTSSTVIRLAAPSGLRLVRAESADPCVIETAGDAFTIRPTQECSKIEIVAEYAADLKEGRLSIGSLAISAAAIRSTLTLQGDNASAPVLDRIPDGLVAVDALVTGTRNYELWGALPPLEVSLVPLSAAEPPKIETELELEPGEASARYQIRIPPSGLNEFVFSAPAGWTLIDLEARAAGTILPTSIQPQKDSRWRVSWSADAPPPEILAFTLHRNGGWGGAGGEESLPLPIVSTSGPRVTSYEMRIAWPDQFDVQTDNLAGLSLVPLSEASGSFSNPSLPVRSALRANAGDPSGVLKIRGRAADARASVVTVLNVAEDRTTVRAQIT
ncbi:hypothetical protein HYR69_07720 [Candidatus Sumerlaeota bacterium]|nr:hypothetical protein [Candidatus Sumerlaeota bacterium]